MSKSDGLEFTGFRQLGRWMLTSKAGERFLSWFARKHRVELMSTALGASFHDWVLKNVLSEREETEGSLTGSLPHIVIETHPDGLIRVFGKGVSVSFVNRLEVQTAAAEVLDEERCWLDANMRQREVYLEKVIAIEHVALHPRNVAELLAQQTRGELNALMDRRARSNRRQSNERDRGKLSAEDSGASIQNDLRFPEGPSCPRPEPSSNGPNLNCDASQVGEVA